MKKALIVAAATSAAVAASGSAQNRGSGTVSYWMSAETVSGLGAMAAGQQGGRSAMVAAMMSGRGPRADAYAHNLRLELGSPRRPSGAPTADHFIPAGLNAGPSLPLVTPEAAPPTPVRPYENPGLADGPSNGRILIYWGCGDHARQGQPYEFDLASLRAGRVPPAMASLAIHAMNPPSRASSTTFGEWPNERSRTPIPANGSLVGAHRISGNYSPDINFTLAQGQDFLPPITLTANTPAAGGAVPVAWQPVTNARAYFLMASGAGPDNTIVIWTSSEVQFSQAGAFDYLAPEEISRLLAQRVLLQPTVTQCTVPAEVATRVQAASLMMTAFGPEANFSYPARPANAPRGWAPDWTVKLRTRSAYTGLLGRDMAAMMRGEGASDERRGTQRQQQQEQRRRRNPLGGLLGRVVGQ
ncbi:hypothetical protein GCM10023232_02330 [Sphingosinicella ginsenosidimutans]|uniref:Uncharacterized protein n=1 Tax=Allosphingosinicella ginsenosidimutans TaxID=1176539 RepID=A0A5C6TUJ4_9SPHN|nr:hypothetical protein [Sphingosinicella ginsenosidimutans]TXC64123.1 hypothetical protein FRZ32_10910 [Sphingosinicella ginsenosidimutans]